jgi:subtilisin family serine protease
MKTLSLCLISLGALVVTACNDIDDQTLIRPSDLAIANPAPSTRDFARNNRAHKVLMGVIDTGVDYNHPALAGNMHFTLDQNGKPIGYGHDFVANDDWASPYVVRTSTDYEIPADDGYYESSDLKALYSTRWVAQAFGLIQTQHPEIRQFIEPRRNVYQEQSTGAYHGTHVAGLMTYDRPDFGLIAYRVLPTNDIPPAKRNQNHDPAAWAEGGLIAAIDRAAADGVRVVNMSLGGPFDVQKNDEATKLRLAVTEEVRQAMLRHPQILFVSAAGNDSKWMDNDTRINFPCGVDVPNQICVGALQENARPAEFTNITLQNVNLIFALGVDVISTYPTLMCSYDSLDSDLSSMAKEAYPSDWKPNSDNGIVLDDELLKNLTEEGNLLSKKCSKMTGFEKLSGTSMATPFVAHAAAEILADHPELSVPELIQDLEKRSEISRIGRLPIRVLKVTKPSWYPKTSAADGKTFRGAGTRS